MKMVLSPRKTPVSLLAAAAAALVLLAAGLWGIRALKTYSTPSGPELSKEIKRVRYGFILRNPNGRAVHNAVLWTYAPLKRTSFQTCRDLRATRDFRRLSPSGGHQILAFRFPAIPPYGRRQVAVRAKLAVNESPRDVPDQELTAWLDPAPFIQSASRPVASRASGLEAATKEGTLHNILGWLNREIEPTGYTSRELGALHALRQREGDCTEFADLYAALARASGIPTRVVAGFVHSGSGVLRAQEYHNWAESLYEGKWHLADPQRNMLDDAASHYIAMSVLGHRHNHPIPRGQLFELRGGDIEVEMK